MVKGSADALDEFAGNECVEINWNAKSYEYSLFRATLKMCNKEMELMILGMN